MDNFAGGRQDDKKWDASMDYEHRSWRYFSLLSILMICALLLSARLIYLYLANAQRFPINTVKISATYANVTRNQLELILSNYLNYSFFSIPTPDLQRDLSSLDWAKDATVFRVWPDTLKISLLEKQPVAIWNDSLLSDDGDLFSQGHTKTNAQLVKLKGPENQQQYVLQIYKKLSKLLSIHALQADSLLLRNNQAWELYLTNGVRLRLGKQNMEQRLQRFCRAYPAVFADKLEQLSSVDLRYARGMAVQWKQQTG